MITIRESTVNELLANAGKLFAAHWDEVALNKSVMTLKPDEFKYRQIEANGGLLMLAAFDDGKLIGYSVNFITNHLHYADLRVCSNDLLFLVSEHRAGRAGLSLIRRTEELAAERGAQMMLWHAKPNTALNAIMPKLGYEVQDIIYSKGI